MAPCRRRSQPSPGRVRRCRRGPRSGCAGRRARRTTDIAPATELEPGGSTTTRKYSAGALYGIARRRVAVWENRGDGFRSSLTTTPMSALCASALCRETPPGKPSGVYARREVSPRGGPTRRPVALEAGHRSGHAARQGFAVRGRSRRAGACKELSQLGIVAAGVGRQALATVPRPTR